MPFVTSLTGANFPPMFNYKSAVFEGSTKYGVIIAVDSALIGKAEEVHDVVLDNAFVVSHPTEMTYLIGNILEAAKAQGLEFDNLLLSDSIEGVSNRLGYFIALNSGKYETIVGYKVKPELFVTARINGLPLGMSLESSNNRSRITEAGFGGADLGEMHVALVNRGYVNNQADATSSLEGELFYEVISHDESTAEAESNQDFGLLEVQVMAAFRISDFKIQFKKVTEVPHSNFGQSGEEQMRTLSYGGGYKGYTAGRSGIADLRKATVRTETVALGRVLLRDVFCLVHKEQTADAAPYERIPLA